MPKEQNPKRTLSVSAISDGTVIDHIAAGQALKIIRLLNLPAEGRTVTVGLNLRSKHALRKDLIKVEHRELTEEEVSRVAILSPDATINIIKDYAVVKKFPIPLPKTIERIFACPNPTCITNHEPMTTVFSVSSNKEGVSLLCRHCEKIFPESFYASF